MAGPRDPSPIIDPILARGPASAGLVRSGRHRGRARARTSSASSTSRSGTEVPRPVPHRGGLLPLRHRVRGRRGRTVPTAVVEVVGTVRMAGGVHHHPPDLRERRRPASRTPRRSSAACTSSASRAAPPASTTSRPRSRSSAAIARCRPRAAEFAVVDVSDTAIAAAAVDNTAVLLGRALMVFALAAAVVGGFAVVQAWPATTPRARGAREVEQALGLTRGQQTAAAPAHRARCPRCSPPSSPAPGALAAAGIEPDRGHRPLRAAPGRRRQRDGAGGRRRGRASSGCWPPRALTGAIGVGAGPMPRSARAPSWAGSRRVGGSPPTVLGLRFAARTRPGRPRGARPLGDHRRHGRARRRRRRPRVRRPASTG